MGIRRNMKATITLKVNGIFPSTLFSDEEISRFFGWVEEGYLTIEYDSETDEVKLVRPDHY
jgi:hypothetical protein